MAHKKQKLKKEPKQRPRSEKGFRGERKPTPKKVKFMKSHKKKE